MNAEKLKQFMRRFPQGVTVVTTSYKDRLWGITVSSFTSISLDPPLVMVSISKTAPSHEAFTNSGWFAVNLLAHDQNTVSEIFAGKVEGAEKFEKVDYSLSKNGLPLIEGVVGYLECRTWRQYEGGDHTIILGEVVDGSVTRDEKPLLYYNRSYTSPR